MVSAILAVTLLAVQAHGRCGVFNAILIDVSTDGDIRGEYSVGSGGTVGECLRILARYCATHGVVLDLSGKVVFDLGQVK